MTLPVAPTALQDKLLIAETPLSPPVELNGKLWGRFLAVTSHPSHNSFPVIVTATVESSIRSGDNVEVTCALGVQYSDYQITYGFGNTVSIVYPCAMGGNVALTHEAERLNSYANSVMGLIGPNASNRATSNDVAWTTLNDTDVGFLLLNAVPYAVAPGAVNFVPATVDQQVLWDKQVGIMDLFLNPLEGEANEIRFVEETDNFFLSTARPNVFFIDTANNVKIGTRHTFSAGQPDSYPRNANFGPPQPIPRFHYNSGVKKFKFSTAEIRGDANGSVAFDRIAISYWRGKTAHGGLIVSPGRNVTIIQSSEGSASVLDDTSGVDSFCSACSEAYLGGDYTYQFKITGLQRLSGADTEGLVMFRETNDTGGRGVALKIYEDSPGNLEFSVLARHTQGGAWSVVDTISSPAALTYPFHVRIAKRVGGDRVTFSVRKTALESETPVYEHSYDFSGDSQPPMAQGFVHILSLGEGRIKWENSDFDDRFYNWRNFNLGQDGKIYSIVNNFFTATAPEGDYNAGVRVAATFPVEGDTSAIVAVNNQTTGEAMVYSTTPARNHYDRVWTSDGGVDHWRFIFYAESAGDVVRVVQAGTYGAGDPGPGRCPRTFGQTNFATPAAGPNPDYEPTSNVNQNRANWMDKLILFDAAEEFPVGVAGVELRIKRNAVFDPAHPPVLQFAFPSGDASVATDWAEVPSAEYLIFPVEGYVYVSEDWLASLRTLGVENVCLRLVGARFQQQGHYHNKMLDRIIDGMESMSDAWMDIGNAYGGAPRMSGGFAGGVGYQYSCNDAFPYGAYDTATPVAAMWGSAPINNTPIYDDMDAKGYGWPHYFEAGDTVYYQDASGGMRTGTFTTAWCEANVNVCIPPEVGFTWPWMKQYSECDQTQEEGYIYRINPFGGNLGNFMGSDTPALLHWILGGPTIGVVAEFNAHFQFNGIGFDINEVIANLPEGTVIESATMRVWFDGLVERTWSVSAKNVPAFPEPFGIAPGFPVPPDVVAHRDTDFLYTVNGTVWYDVEYRWTGGGVGEITKYDGTRSTVPTGAENPDSTTASIGFILIGERRNSTKVFTPNSGNYHPIPDGDYRTFPGSIAVTSVPDGEWTNVDVTAAIQSLVNAKDTLYTRFFFWPTVATVQPSDSDGTLLSYLKSLKPATTATLVREFRIDGVLAKCGWQATWSGRFVTWHDLQAGSIHIRFRLPSGILDSMSLPLFVAPAITPP